VCLTTPPVKDVAVKWLKYEQSEMDSSPPIIEDRYRLILPCCIRYGIRILQPFESRLQSTMQPSRKSSDCLLRHHPRQGHDI
jgi:hypothetical protein